MTNKIDSLQIIRCFAAILVVICHIWNDGWLPQIIVDLGGFGVDLFFVLSGFIMCLTVKLNMDNKVMNASHFLQKRIVRIFPIYIICAIPLLLFNIKAEGFKHLYYYIGNLLLLPSFYNDSTYAFVLGPGWSLAYEMLFYYTFAFFILFAKNKNMLLVMNSLFLFLLVVSIRIFNLQGPQLGWVNLNYIIGDTLLWNFGLGIVVYYIFIKLKDCVQFNIQSGLFFLVFLSTIAAALHSYGSPRFIAFGIPAFIIVSMFTLIKNYAGESTILKRLIYIGDASYSVYLIHYYFVFFKPKVLLLERFFNIGSNVFLNTVDILLVIGAIAGGCLFYIVIEQPIIKHLSQKHFQKQISPIVE